MASPPVDATNIGGICYKWRLSPVTMIWLMAHPDRLSPNQGTTYNMIWLSLQVCHTEHPPLFAARLQWCSTSRGSLTTANTCLRYAHRQTNIQTQWSNTSHPPGGKVTRISGHRQTCVTRCIVLNALQTVKVDTQCNKLATKLSWQSFTSKVAKFAATAPAFGASVGVTPFEFCQDFWRQKTRVPGYRVAFMWSYI